HVADRPEPDRLLLVHLTVEQGVVRPLGEQNPVPVHDPPPMGEVQRGDLDGLAVYVLPDVHLGPVGEREYAEVFARVLAPVEEMPELGPLVLRVPLAEGVSVTEEALLGPGLLLVAPSTAERRLDLELA